VHLLVHGTTRHGTQNFDPAWRREPLTYYGRSGPLGQVFAELAAQKQAPHIAVIGLGAGTIAAYLGPGQRLTYYEIDPSIVRTAQDRAYFSYLADSKGEIDIVLGDGRLTLAGATDGAYGLVVVDAFSSDAIPLHLLTREAMTLYMSKLAPRGILAIHISNRYLDLEPVVGELAADAGLAALVQLQPESRLAKEARDAGQTASDWVIVARRSAESNGQSTPSLALRVSMYARRQSKIQNPKWLCLAASCRCCPQERRSSTRWGWATTLWR
jgi:hypothetical protein